jgi:SET domain-containing protein
MLISIPEGVPWAMTLQKESGMQVHVWIGKSRIAGKGLFAGQDIPKDTIITRYLGTKISKAQSARALAHGNAYICALNDRYDIDGNTLKNTARYINHSCEPNCVLQTTGRAVWVVALRDIQAGEELTHQYNYTYDPARYTEFPCGCGANHCVGYIVDARYWEVIRHHHYGLTG